MGIWTPNADREDSIPDNQATFLMSNMVAQSPDNNQGPWADFENYLRSVVRGTPANEIYIVSGPVGTGGTGSNGAANTTAGGNVTVPSSTWKVALVLPDNGTMDDISRVNCSTTTVAVIMPNIQGIFSNPWQTYLTTVSAVEALTGYQFFTNLPQPIQNCIKAGTNGVNPKNNQTINFDRARLRDGGRLHPAHRDGLVGPSGHADRDLGPGHHLQRHAACDRRRSGGRPGHTGR